MLLKHPLFLAFFLILCLSKAVFAVADFQPAQITSPASGAVLLALPAIFQWSAGKGVAQYQLTIGSSSGARDIYNQNQGTNLSVTVNNLPANGSPLYVNIYSYDNTGEVVLKGNEVVYQTMVLSGHLFFVDPLNGNDSNPGTVIEPFKTIPTALGQITTIKNANDQLLDMDVHILLRAGTYYNNQTLVLGSAYSGNNGKTVFLQAYPGETPIISGGQKIGTIPASSSSSQWTTTILDGSFKRLRVGNSMAIRARYPAYNSTNPYTTLYDPNNPSAGGELSNDWCGLPWEKGQFNYIMQTGGTQGLLGWNNIKTQFAGTYYVWVRYAWPGGAVNNSVGFSVDNAPAITFSLASTGSWYTYAWVKAGQVSFSSTGTQTLNVSGRSQGIFNLDVARQASVSSAGTHTLNISGGSQGTLNLDAFILTSDSSFNPTNNQDFIINSDGSYSIPSSYSLSGKDLLVIQAESATSVTGGAAYQNNGAASNIGVYGFQNTLCFYPGTYPTTWSQGSWAQAVLYYYPASLGPSSVTTITAACPPSGPITAQCPIATSNGYIILNSSAGLKPAAGDRFFIENVPDALSQNGGAPNEWYLDPSSRTLTYNAPAGTTSQDVVAATVNTIMQLQGTSGSYISNMIIDGLTFMDTDYLDWVYTTNSYNIPVSYALELDYANNITIRNSTFENLGSHAIGLEDSSYHNFIYSNTLNNLGGGGIGIGYNSNLDTSSNANVISFNNISNTGTVYNSTDGVVISSGSDNLISNNNITHTSSAGVWMNAQEGNHSYGNAIEYNSIIDTNQNSNDSGALYIWSGGNWADTGTVFKYNFIKNTGGVQSTSFGDTINTPAFTNAIYLDQYVGGVDIYGNVIENASNAAVKTNGNKNISIKNNIFYNSLYTAFDLIDWSTTLQNWTVTNNIIARPSQLQDNPLYIFESLGRVSQASFENAFPNINHAYEDNLFTCLQNNNYFNQNGDVMVDLSSTANQTALQNLLQTTCNDTNNEFSTILGVLQQVSSVRTYFNNVDDNLYTGIDLSTTYYSLTSMGIGWSSWTNPYWIDSQKIQHPLTGYDTDDFAYVNQDPLFVDPTHSIMPGTINDNFTLQSGSLAFQTPFNFQQIPLNQIGNIGYPVNNHAPVFAPVATQTVNSSGQTVSFTVTANSQDSDIVSISLLNPPQGFTFSPNGSTTINTNGKSFNWASPVPSASGTFTWIAPEPGTYDVGFLVQDSKGLSDIMTVEIDVMWNAQYYWPFDEGSGAVSHEQNFNLNNAILNFNWACTAAANCPNGPSGWTTGISGNALLFNKNYGDSVIILNDNYNLFPANNGAFSIAFWFKANSLTPNAQNSIMSDGNYLFDGFRIAINTGNENASGPLYFWSTQSGGTLSLPNGNNIPSSDYISTGKWYQVVISYTGSGATLYLNGQAVDTEQGIVNPTSSDLSIANTGGTTPFDGIFDGLKIYNTALSASDVASLYNNYQPQSLGITMSGSGTVTSSPAGINCGSTCSVSFNYGTVVTLTPAPSSGSVFSGWSGACKGTGTCTVTMNSAQNVTASFNVPVLSASYSGSGMVFGAIVPVVNNVNLHGNLFESSVEKSINPMRAMVGSLTSQPIRPIDDIIYCGVDADATICSTTASPGTMVNLTATPDTGWTFSGWSGACSGTGICTVQLNANVKVTAEFTPPAPVNGACGTASQTYVYGTTSFGSNPLCKAGNSDPATVAFPGPGESVGWTCLGFNNGLNKECSARQENN